MDTKQHAQQLYSMLLAAKMTSGQPMPTSSETGRWSEMAWMYAEAFENYSRSKKSGNVI